MRKGGKFFVFWLPRFNTFSSKFLDKKKRDTEREKETNEMEREREREILLILLVGVFFRGKNVSLFSFSRKLFVF